MRLTFGFGGVIERTVELPTRYAPSTVPVLVPGWGSRVALSWSPVEEPEVVGYVLYRSPSAGGDYREIAYYFGFNLCLMTMKKGRVIYRAARFGEAFPERKPPARAPDLSAEPHRPLRDRYVREK